MNPIPSKVAALRKYFNQGLTRPYQYRMHQLNRLACFLAEREQEIEQALYQDLHKSPAEAFAAEIAMVKAELKMTQRHLKKWMQPQRVSTSLPVLPGKSRIYNEPLGVVLIIAPWNYPIQLTLVPLIGAIAAGNAVVIKPSEMAPATSRLLASLLPHYLDANSVEVIEGGVAETTTLLDQVFDYIFYTGSGAIGRVVMSAAAKHLTPVTLELGGKSPCLIDETADLETAAARIIWGKFSNAGQTCVAPDYLLVHEAVEEKLISLLKATLIRFYGDHPEQSADFGRIINTHHYQRLIALIPGSGEVVTGGHGNPATLYIAPTLLRGVRPDMPVMQEEIFGPLLPIITVKSMNEAIQFVNARPKSLAAYLFSSSKWMQEEMITRTSSGSVCINHVLIQLAVTRLPFGGVGASGMGAYHGKASFDTFTHYKSVLFKPTWFDPSMMYPPYSSLFRRLLRWVI